MICTVILDVASNTVLRQDGDCTTRVTPASTFKIPLAVMGFDSGFLKEAHSPVFAYRVGDPDWGGENWKQATDPTRWLQYSVVWYSQRITHALGEERLTDYAKRFNFGNADFTGDPGKHNGLERAWIISSLKVSPREQVDFLTRLIRRSLPVSPDVYDKLDAILQVDRAGEWQVHGKTGLAFPRISDDSFDEAHGFGWYVGWAKKGDRTVVFARLDQDERKEKSSASVRAKNELLDDLSLIAR